MTNAAARAPSGAPGRPRGAGPASERHAALGTTGWLRPLVLGAEDGIVSTAALVIGVSAAGGGRQALLAAGMAGLVSGALSMAAGEYVSVAAQRDAEQSDIALERWELAHAADAELEELTEIYRQRGLSDRLASEVASALTTHDALGTHLREELAIDQRVVARPWQAAWMSAASFATGATLPLATILLAGRAERVLATIVVTLVVLAGAGAIGARLGRSNLRAGMVRVVLGGACAMAATWGAGALLGRAFH